MNESSVGGLRQLRPLFDVPNVAGDAARLGQSVHPLRQIMVVLPVPLPFQPGIVRLVGGPLFERLADAKTASRRMLLSLLVAKPAYPSRPLALRAEAA